MALPEIVYRLLLSAYGIAENKVGEAQYGRCSSNQHLLNANTLTIRSVMGCSFSWLS